MTSRGGGNKNHHKMMVQGLDAEERSEMPLHLPDLDVEWEEYLKQFLAEATPRIANSQMSLRRDKIEARDEETPAPVMEIKLLRGHQDEEIDPNEPVISFRINNSKYPPVFEPVV